MLKSKFVVTAGLVCTLALGAMGCSSTSTSSSSTTVTDENGTETTTTTTTTTDEAGTQTTETTTSTSETTDLSEVKYYTLDAAGLRYDVPEGYVFNTLETDIDLSGGTAKVFSVINADGSNFNCMVEDIGDKKIDVASDEYLDTAIEQAKLAFKDGEDKLTAAKKSSVVIADGKKLPAVEFTIETNGNTLQLAQAYAVRDGKVFTFTATASDPAEHSVLFGGLTLED